MNVSKFNKIPNKENKDSANKSLPLLADNPKQSKQKLKKSVYVQSLKSGNTCKQAASDADAGVTTIWEWKQVDKQFSNNIDSALESRIQVVEDALFNTATGKEGKAKVIAQIFWLKNRGKNWKDKQDITFIAPQIVRQNSFIQAGEAPKIEEEEEEIPKIEAKETEKEK